MPSMTRPKGRKQFHVHIDTDECRRIKVVAAEEGTTSINLFRDIFMEEINRRYQAITGRKARSI